MSSGFGAQDRAIVGNVLPIFSTCPHLHDFVENVSKNFNHLTKVSQLQDSAAVVSDHKKVGPPVESVEDYYFSENLNFSVKVLLYQHT